MLSSNLEKYEEEINRQNSGLCRGNWRMRRKKKVVRRASSTLRARGREEWVIDASCLCPSETPTRRAAGH